MQSQYIHILQLYKYLMFMSCFNAIECTVRDIDSCILVGKCCCPWLAGFNIEGLQAENDT